LFGLFNVRARSVILGGNTQNFVVPSAQRRYGEFGKSVSRTIVRKYMSIRAIIMGDAELACKRVKV
jgi:hypothetical protein